MNAGAVISPLVHPHASGWPTAAELVTSEPSVSLPSTSEADALSPKFEEILQSAVPGRHEWLAFADQCWRRALDLIRTHIAKGR